VLYGLTGDDLRRVRFPLGRKSKAQVRALAAAARLPVAHKPESQEICFVPSGDYRDLVRSREPAAFAPGEIVDRDGRVLGTHAGVASFTVGQRKGLGVAGPEPLYVARIEAQARRVVVAPRAQLGVAEAALDDVVWSGGAPQGDLEVEVSVRYRAGPVRATVTPGDRGHAQVRFHQPAWPVTPGQAAVFYGGEVVLGGGRIRACS
jgi:tRNA-specific 2-thiouridylase